MDIKGRAWHVEAATKDDQRTVKKVLKRLLRAVFNTPADEVEGDQVVVEKLKLKGNQHPSRKLCCIKLVGVFVDREVLDAIGGRLEQLLGIEAYIVANGDLELEAAAGYQQRLASLTL